MEEVRKAARAHYSNLSESGKKQVGERFEKLDTDGDGAVSRLEYANYVKERNLGTNLFEILDKSDDSTLDFDQFNTFRYLYYQHQCVLCDRCGVVLLGVYFTCVNCYDDAGSKTYNLCSKCYGSRSFEHSVEGHNYFRDIHSLFRMRKPKPAAKSTPSRDMMEELVETANIYYKTSSSEIKQSAENFFQSLDSDNDGKVSFHEFLGFMRANGNLKMSNRHFFEVLDKDGSGTLEFMEVMALYYIIKTGRPFCGGCGELICGVFFTCSKCFDEGENEPFCVCPSCFESGKYVHEHRHPFLDNYALLERKRLEAIGMRGTANANLHKPRSSVSIGELTTYTASATNVNCEIVHYNQPENAENKASKIASTIFDLAVRPAFCTIM